MHHSGAIPLSPKDDYYRSATHLSDVVLEAVSNDLTHSVSVFVSDESKIVNDVLLIHNEL